MKIIFHAHHAAMPPGLKDRARRKLTKLGEKLGRAVDAVVRVEGDGPRRRVELELHAPRARSLVAEGTGRTVGPALTAALARLDARIARLRTRRATARKTRVVVPRTRRPADA